MTISLENVILTVINFYKIFRFQKLSIHKNKNSSSKTEPDLLQYKADIVDNPKAKKIERKKNARFVKKISKA